MGGSRSRVEVKNAYNIPWYCSICNSHNFLFNAVCTAVNHFISGNDQVMFYKNVSGTASAEDVPEDIEEEEEGELDEGDDEELVSGSDEGDTSSRSSRPTSPCLDRRQRKTFPRVDAQARGIKLTEYPSQMKARPGKKRFDLQEGASASGYRDDPLDRREQIKRSRKNDFPDTNSGLEPATVTSDPLDWTVNDVEQYVTGQPAISHHAVKLKEQEVDGRAFLLLNLPTLVQHLGLPHSSAVALAQHICRVKLAHFMFFYRTET